MHARPRSRLLALGIGALTLVSAGVLVAPGSADAATPVSRSVSFGVSDVTAGYTTWTVPATVTSITVTATGGNGGGSLNNGVGGSGAAIVATATVNPGDQLTVAVGSRGGTNPSTGGAPGGGSQSVNGVPGGGGGFSGVLRSDRTPLVVAGAGGGSGLIRDPGGDAGQAAPDATDNGRVAGGGGAGTQTAGGAGGTGAASGAAGSLYQGGTPGGGGGGGGGGGYYGGGGGASNFAGSGGGGGSSYPAPGSPAIRSFALKSTTAPADGSVVIQYTVEQYSVAFDSAGGTPTPATQAVDGGTPAAAPTQPTWAGHTFGGWFTSASGGTAWTFSTPVVRDLTLFAHWAIPTITLSAGSVAPGASVTVNGSGFAASTSLDIVLNSTPVTLATVATDPAGAFSTTVTVPSSTAPGAHSITVGTASAALSVVSTAVRAAALAPTGPDVSPGLRIVVILFAAGIALLLTSRRRRDAR